MLSGARSALSSAIQERSRVTELLCHSISSTYHYDQNKAMTPRHLKCSSAPPIMLCGQLPETTTGHIFTITINVMFINVTYSLQCV